MVGVDEVGRGSWAGPLLVVAAQQIDELPLGLTDSKLLSRAQRERLFVKLQKSCKFGEGWVEPNEIDVRGLARALTLGSSRALKSLEAKFTDEILLDGRVNYLPKAYKRVKAAVDADLNLAIVSAASVYAKVRRDWFMCQLARKHPHYGFENHMGYGTHEHKSALKSLGALKDIHRQTFKPIMEL